MPMSAVRRARIADRSVVCVEGRDSTKLLQGIITNDVEDLEVGNARHAALLSPQGKILFDFFAVRTAGGFFLDTSAALAADLVKRLSLYKLRADVQITQAADFSVFADWSEAASVEDLLARGVAFRDPRHPLMGLRLLANEHNHFAGTGVETYAAHRVRLGVPEGGKDYAFGDTYPHEALFDRLYGVSFTKGCYVGQEVVARMQHKTIVRKRVVNIAADAPLVEGVDICVGDVVIGKIGTVDGANALAMLRLDRALEAREQGKTLRSGDATITPDPDSLAGYSAALAKQAAPART